MKLGTTGYEALINRKGEVWFKDNSSVEWDQLDPSYEGLIRNLLTVYRSGYLSDQEKKNTLDYTIEVLRSKSTGGTTPTVSLEDIKEVVGKIMDFFTEFHFEPNFRFINTLSYMTKLSRGEEYIVNYFKLIDSPYVESIQEKMKSIEFKNIINKLTMIHSSKKINNRFKLYYGSQGTGKTTKGMDESDGLVMVCHSAMLPQDLMEDFKFVDGHPDFQPSVLQNAITEGKTIVLDEINLLPFESLRFLQSILDGKQEFSYKGKTIKIAEGFKIIGTMNLVVNGCVFSLPEPLIDRAEDLKEFKLTAGDLMGALV